jgi:hypothetical protein
VSRFHAVADPFDADYMSYGHTIDPDRRFIFQVFEGHFSIQEVMDCSRRLWSDPAYCRDFYGIVDISRMTTDTNIDGLHELIEFYRNSPNTTQVRWAAITSSPWLTAGSMLYRNAMAGRHALEIFSTWDSARIYLQLDLPSPPEMTFFDVSPGASSQATI